MVYPTRSKAIRDIASWIELEHTIRNDSTPPWGTGRPTRSRRSTEQQDKQPERPLSGLRCLVFLGQWWKEYCFER